ncbi:MAG: hypothetical protein LC789_08965 [Actinobacteria bacterium]|nr:hypothetical protein [Actinomycetota bacterium]MCA1720317.1 hypothetical protein [Actinomycetota bacterium]
MLGAVALLAAVTFTELRPVTVARRGQRQTFTLIEGPLVTALAMAPGRYIVLAVAAGMLLAQIVRRVTPYKALFNISQYALASGAAGLCAQAFPRVGGVVLGILTFAIINDGAVRLILRVATGQPQGYVFQGAGSAWLMHVAAVTSVALIAADTMRHDVMLLPAFVVPGLLIQYSQEQANRRRARGVVASALAAQATSLYGRSSHESAALVVRSARELLSAQIGEIVLLGNAGAISVRDSGRGRELMEGRVAATDLLTDWRGCVLETVHASAHGHWAGVVIGRTTPHALLQVTRSADQEAFRDSDLALLQELADTCQSWLDVDVEADYADTVRSTRRRAAELGGAYVNVADALGAIDRVRQQLERPAAAHADRRDSYLTDELRLAEEAIAAFVSDLIAAPAQREADSDTVHTGRWAGVKQ